MFKTNDLRGHLDKLHPFLVISRSPSMRQAAEQLRLTQPSLTHTIRTLENALGTPLFERSRRGLTLTETGKELARFAERVAAELQTLDQKLLHPKSELASQLTLGTYESFAIRFWPEFVRKFSRQHPEIGLAFQSGDQRSLTQQVLAGQTHAALLALPAAHPELQQEVLYQDTFGLYRSPHYEQTSPKLDEHPLVFVPSAEADSGYNLEQLLWQEGIHPRRRFALNTFEAVKEFAIHRTGIAILPKRIAAEAIASKKLTAIESSPLPKNFGVHRVGLIYRHSDRPRPLDILIRELKSSTAFA